MALFFRRDAYASERVGFVAVRLLVRQGEVVKFGEFWQILRYFGFFRPSSRVFREVSFFDRLKLSRTFLRIDWYQIRGYRTFGL
jgi:hypothetical protein